MRFLSKTKTVTGHPYEPMLAVSGIDHTIKIFSPDNRAQHDARRGRNLNVDPNRGSVDTSFDARMSRRRHRPNLARELATERTSSRQPPPLDSNDDDRSAGEDEEAGNGRNGGSCQNVGLSSRRRMYDSYRIISQNDIDRAGGNNETYITVSGPSFPLRPVPISFAEWIEMIHEVEAVAAGYSG